MICQRSGITIEGDSVRFSMAVRGTLVHFAAGIHGNEMVGTANMGAPETETTAPSGRR